MQRNHFFKSSLLFLAVLLFNIGFSQKGAVSPRDSTKGKAGEANVTIVYNSPSVKGRTVWGKLVPYGQVWRAGANEATQFITDKDIEIGGKVLPAGHYSFFAIPSENKWTIIFNKVAKQWGAFEYSPQEDALRVDVVPHKLENTNERLVYKIDDEKILLTWEKIAVPIYVKAHK